MSEMIDHAAQSLHSLTLGITWLGIGALALSMAVGCLLLLRFPEVADRAIVFDLVMVHVTGLIALSAIVLDYPLLLDTLIVVAVLGFLSTVAIARYLERGVRPPADDFLPLTQPDEL